MPAQNFNRLLFRICLVFVRTDNQEFMVLEENQRRIIAGYMTDLIQSQVHKMLVIRK